MDCRSLSLEGGLRRPQQVGGSSGNGAGAKRICRACNIAGDLRTQLFRAAEFFSSRRRFQNRTSIRFGVVASRASSKCVSTLSATVERRPHAMFVTDRWLRVSPQDTSA